jgi:hypothetical protein
MLTMLHELVIASVSQATCPSAERFAHGVSVVGYNACKPAIYEEFSCGI